MNATVSPDAKPALKSGMRLQWEPAQNSHVLLFPEGVVKLNGSASQILLRCTGAATVREITKELETLFNRENLEPEVASFMAFALERQWLELRP
jgi:pyrroloquinoline quinone biosynthesis protein D